MKRLLCIISCMNTGGAETFLMKMFRNIDRKQYMMDFCVISKENYYEEEIKQLGGKMFYIPLKSKYPVKSFNAIRRIVKENNYNYVIRVNEHSLSTIDLLAAKSGGAKVLAMRSSNASSGSKISVSLHKMFIFLPKIIPYVKFAPSKLAAKYTFGKKCIENNKAMLLNNGLNTKQFTYSVNKRCKIRNQLGIEEDKTVIGHIGRFNTQKNHEFLIDIFNEFHKRNSNSILVLVGKGNLEDKIKDKVKKLGLANNVLFLGVRKDIPELLCAFDLFLFPSFYEGMPNTVIEAQTTGLPCLISDSITEEAKVTDIVTFASLNDTASKWSDECLNILNRKYLSREEYAEIMKEKGYDTIDCANKFIKMIFESERIKNGTK